MHVWHGKHQSILYTLECTRAYPSWTPQVLLHSPHRIYQVLQSQACLKARARVITYKTAHKTGQLYKSTGCVTWCWHMCTYSIYVMALFSSEKWTNKQTMHLSALFKTLGHMQDNHIRHQVRKSVSFRSMPVRTTTLHNSGGMWCTSSFSLVVTGLLYKAYLNECRHIPAEAKAIPHEGGIGSCLLHLMSVCAVQSHVTSLQSTCEQLRRSARHSVASPDKNMTPLIL